jgi:FkbM family methyltransferase
LKFRTQVLEFAGRTGLARAWARGKCKPQGIDVRRVGGNVRLQRGNRAVMLSSKHIFFAPVVCENFDVFASALPVEMRDGVMTADFTSDPYTFSLCRVSLRYGVMIQNVDGSFRLKKDKRVMIISPRHLIYSTDMAERFDLYFSPLVPQERDGELVLDFSRPGNLQRYAKSGLEFEMASFPEEDDAIEEYFKYYRPKPGDLVFDMGAHCGVSSYHLSKLVGPAGKVVCFEPDPTNFGILKRNIARHGLTNVIAENAAIAGTTGKLAFNSEGTIGSSLTSLLLRDSVGTTVTVDAMTMADAFERWGVPAFCKIDIEGAEIEVVRNSADLLRRHKLNFALDTNHPRADGTMTDGDIESMFRSYGYEAASDANPMLTTWAWPAQ